jgi:ribosomal protein L32
VYVVKTKSEARCSVESAQGQELSPAATAPKIPVGSARDLAERRLLHPLSPILKSPAALSKPQSRLSPSTRRKEMSDFDPQGASSVVCPECGGYTHIHDERCRECGK